MGNFCGRCGKRVEYCECNGNFIPPPPIPPPAPKPREKGTEARIRLNSFLGIDMPEDEIVDCFETGKKIVPDMISPNEGEIPVKQYDLAVLRTRLLFTKAKGRLQVTNQRVIFRAAGRSLVGRTSLQHEFSMAEIGGVEIRRDWRFDLLNFIGTVLLGITVTFLFSLLTGWVYGKSETLGFIVAFLLGAAGMVPFFLMKKHFFIKALTSAASIGAFSGLGTFSGFGGMTRSMPNFNSMTDKQLSSFIDGTSSSSALSADFAKFVLILVAIFVFIATVFFLISLFLGSILPNLVIMVKTKSAGGAIEICRSKLFDIVNKGAEYTGFDEVLPGKDADMAVKELGAMIGDIQTMGDMAVGKWRKD